MITILRESPTGNGYTIVGGSGTTPPTTTGGNGLVFVPTFGNPKFDAVTTTYATKTVDATPINLVPIEVGSIAGARAIHRIIADGVASHAPTINGAAISNWNNAAGTINLIEWLYDGYEYVYECRQVN
jgi:hypothetical protein